MTSLDLIFSDVDNQYTNMTALKKKNDHNKQKSEIWRDFLLIFTDLDNPYTPFNGVTDFAGRILIFEEQLPMKTCNEKYVLTQRIGYVL